MGKFIAPKHYPKEPLLSGNSAIRRAVITNEELTRYQRKTLDEAKSSVVDHPQHYGGEHNPYEAIKVIEAWALNFNLGNTVKYIARAGKKDSSKLVEDLKKAQWYLQREIANLELKEVRNK